MNAEELIEQNPWWREPDASDTDPIIEAYEASKVRWEPILSASMDLGKDRIYTLRGPRQVGKTTLLKLKVRELLRAGASPLTVLYVSCDMVGDGKDL